MQTNMQLKIRPLLIVLTVVFVLSAIPFHVNAMSLSWGLFPESQTVVVGQPFRLELVVSGLGDGGPPSLEGFDVDITFSDVFTVNPSSVVFGPFLGNPNDAAQTQITASLIGSEVLFLREESFLPVPTLDAIQGSSFILASMTFTGSDLGTFLFTGDDFAGGLFLTDGTSEQPGITNAFVTVVPVPEPATILLLGSGLIGFAIVRKKFKR